MLQNAIDWDLGGTEATLAGQTYEGILLQDTDRVDTVPAGEREVYIRRWRSIWAWELRCGFEWLYAARVQTTHLSKTGRKEATSSST